jgi:hypothetical protein
MRNRASSTAVNSRRLCRRIRSCTLSSGVELAELLGAEEVLGSVSLRLHVRELAVRDIELLDEAAHGAKQSIRRQVAHAERMRDLGTYRGADHQLAAAHLLRFGRERARTSTGCFTPSERGRRLRRCQSERRRRRQKNSRSGSWPGTCRAEAERAKGEEPDPEHAPDPVLQ